MKLRKVVSVLMAAMLSVGLLAGSSGGSGGGTESEGSDSGKQEAEAGKEVTIWYYWETEGHQKALDKVISDYNASQDVHREWKNSFGYICCKCKED